ncbi:MAG: efflux RND transporter periplasmic adaptor subunit [Candidatus Gastranaerophilales bacterium]|nr:efflux RND transporter periplasmic adaptor subunit [Candidatus Gastranaerophilales bacterium]
MNKKWIKIIGMVCLGAFVLRFASGMIMGFFMKRPTPTVEYITIQQEPYSKGIKLSGRVVAIHSVDIKARVQGILLKKYFSEGTFVQKGQQLFLIEPTQYIIAVQKANASIANAKASLVELDKNLVRIKQLVANDFVSRSEYDKALAGRDMARADLSAARAQLADARLNLAYTNIKAPVSGRIGNLAITEGNLVDLNTPCLATIMSLQPIYVTFDIAASDYIELQKTIANNDAVVEIKLPDGSLYPEFGKLDFYNNKVEEMTGTVKLRATFNNKDNLLLPGEFVEARITFGKPRNVYTLPQNLVLQDSKGKYVYAVDTDKNIKIIHIEVGESIGNKWIVTKGLSPEDRVVSSNLQSIRPDIKVKVKGED